MRNRYRLDLSGQHPKGWNGFLDQRFDYVITVCGRAAEECPVFPGEPERIQWHIEDPAAARGEEPERRRAFEQVASDLTARIRIWLALPRLRQAVEGESGAATGR